jgi:hypothetical protein
MRIEARGVSGSVTQGSFTVMSVPPGMLTGSGIVGALALTAAVMAIRRGGGLGWTLGIFAVLVALAGLGMVAFAVWGRYAGLPWSFIPAGQ